MKYYWLALIPAFALGGLNQLYDAWPGSSSSLASVERECNRMVTKEGLDRSVGRPLCACMVEKASDWRDANPDAEYTRDAHTTIAATCVNRVDREQIIAQAKARKRAQSRPGYRPRSGAPGEGPPSDWGGGGFAEEQAFDGDQ